MSKSVQGLMKPFTQCLVGLPHTWNMVERNCVEKKLDSAKRVTGGTPGGEGNRLSGDSDSGSSPPPETLSWKAEAGARKAEIGHTWRLVSQRGRVPAHTSQRKACRCRGGPQENGPQSS